MGKVAPAVPAVPGSHQAAFEHFTSVLRLDLMTWNPQRYAMYALGLGENPWDFWPMFIHCSWKTHWFLGPFQSFGDRWMDLWVDLVGKAGIFLALGT